VAKMDPDIEVLRDKGSREPGNDPWVVWLAILAVWAMAFVAGLRLRHPLARIVLALMALGFSVYLAVNNRRPRR